MTNYIWTENTKPDRPGIWLREDASGSMHAINVYPCNIDGWPIAKYCFLADWPTVKDPPKPREWWIELNEHYGFSNWSRHEIVGRKGREVVHVREVIE